MAEQRRILAIVVLCSCFLGVPCCGGDSGGSLVDVGADSGGQQDGVQSDVGVDEVADPVDQKVDTGSDLTAETDQGLGDADVQEVDTPVCVPDCLDKQCGYDGCGGFCGQCPEGAKCQLDTGLCWEPSPLCGNKECGDDGEGGSCGDCPPEKECLPGGICGDPPACEYCVPPYPICTKLAGIWQCLACYVNEDCPAGHLCDPVIHECFMIPPDNAGECDAQTACIESDMIMFDLQCSLEQSRCFDTVGWCDGVYATCHSGVDCALLGTSVPNGLMGPKPDFLPPGSTYGTVGLCPCQQPVDEMCFLPPNIPDTCTPSPECFGDQFCIPASALAGLFPISLDSPGYCMSGSLFLPGW